MADHSTTTQVNLFDDTLPFTDDLDEVEDVADLLGYLDPPLLLVDTDPDRAIERQKTLMDTCFGGIGEERKVEKRLGLALQELDVEQRHALRLLICFEEAAELIAHLQRCLAEPAYGYGERGDQGRTVAQAMAAVGDLPEVAAAWLEQHRFFQQRVLAGEAFSFRSIFDTADLDSFVPLVQRVGAQSWQLGVEGEGKHRRFEGDLATIWPKLCDTYVAWSEADNEAWLADLKRRTERRPPSILTMARAEALRKEQHRLEVHGQEIVLITEKDEAPDWPRRLTLGDQVGLSRLSGHSYYELAWAGGLHVRRFELSSTSRQKIPVEHIELATALAETLALEAGLELPPVTAEQVEAAYLRRLKVERVSFGQPDGAPLSQAVRGRAMVVYRAGPVSAYILHDDRDLIYATARDTDTGILIQRDPARERLVALTVTRGRLQGGEPLQTTSLSDIDLTDGGGLRSVAAWAAWLASMVGSK